MSRCLDGAGLSPHCPLLFPGWPATFLSLLSPPRPAVSPSLPSSGTGRLQTSLRQPTWRQASPGRLSVSSLLHRPRASVPKRWFICAEPHLPLVRVRPACPLRDGSLTRPPSLYSTTVCWLPRDCGPRLPCPLPHGPPKKTFVLWQRRWLPLCSFSQDVACFWSGAGCRSPLLHGGSLSPRLRAQPHGRCLTALSSP